MYFTMELMDMIQDALEGFEDGDMAKVYENLNNLESALDYLISNDVRMVPGKLYKKLCELANAEVIVVNATSAEGREDFKRKKINRNNRKENKNV